MLSTVLRPGLLGVLLAGAVRADIVGDGAASASLAPDVARVDAVRQEVQALRGNGAKVATRHVCQGRVTVSTWRAGAGQLRLLQRRSSVVSTNQANTLWATYDATGALRYVRWSVRDLAGQSGEAQLYFTAEGGRRAVPFLTRLHGHVQRLNSTSVPVQLGWLRNAATAARRALGCQDSRGRPL